MNLLSNLIRVLTKSASDFKPIALVLSGIPASSAGILRGLLLTGVSSNVQGIDFTMEPLLMTIIGGMGTFVGPVLGAFGLRLTE